MLKTIALGILLFRFFASTATSKQRADYASDNSDWWSLARNADLEDGSITPKKREPAESNLRILGAAVDDGFTKVASTLGPAAIIKRGDGATGRSQVCYVLASVSHRTYLIFEKGEVNDAFYIFLDGDAWEGRDRCVPLKSDDQKLRTESGLQLGMAASEVRRILGKPSREADGKLVYEFEVDKKSSEAEFAQIRKTHPDLSEQELRKQYDSYTAVIYFELRFNDDRVSYIAVSKVETY